MTWPRSSGSGWELQTLPPQSRTSSDSSKYYPSSYVFDYHIEKYLIFQYICIYILWYYIIYIYIYGTIIYYVLISPIHLVSVYRYYISNGPLYTERIAPKEVQARLRLRDLVKDDVRTICIIISFFLNISYIIDYYIYSYAY